MQLFGQNITLQDMPSYQSFQSSPNHIYTSFQDTLSNSLGPQGPSMMIQQQATNQQQQVAQMPGLQSAEQQSNQWQ